MTKEATGTFENKLFQSLGEITMCWEPRPTGVFDDTNAIRVGKEIHSAIKQEIYGILKWLLTPNEEMTITSGDNVWYVNGEETSHEKLYELYTQSKQ